MNLDICTNSYMYKRWL